MQGAVSHEDKISKLSRISQGTRFYKRNKLVKIEIKKTLIVMDHFRQRKEFTRARNMRRDRPFSKTLADILFQPFGFNVHIHILNMISKGKVNVSWISVDYDVSRGRIEINPVNRRMGFHKSSVILGS